MLQKEISEVLFHFLEGENEGVEIRVNPPRELIVGRSEECDIFLGEKKISRKHCKIAVAADGVRLIDLQSTNGTFLNAKKVSETTVQHEDKIRVGSSVIQVMVAAEASLGNEPVKEAAPADEPVTGTLPEPGPEDERPFEAVSPEVEREPSGVADIPAEDEGFSFEDEKPEEIRIEPSAAPPPEIVSAPKQKPLAGNLSAMGLADLLQNLVLNQKSGILQLHAGQEGKIWIVSGRIVTAAVGATKGAKALYRMLGWNEGTFELSALPPDFDEASAEAPISESVEGLLMEGFRQFDELEKIRKGLPTPAARLRMKPKFTAPLSKLHPRVLDILQVVLNEEKFQAVLDASPLSDLETSKVVFYLLKKDYIVAE